MTYFIPQSDPKNEHIFPHYFNIKVADKIWPSHQKFLESPAYSNTPTEQMI